MNDKLIQFVEKFEKEFGSLLLTPPRSVPSIYTDYFLAYANKKKHKYSDWDIDCWLKPEKVTKGTLSKIDSFIRSYDGASSLGRLLPAGEKYRNSTYHHIETTQVLHYMGIFLNEQNCPLFDITIHHVNKHALRNAFPYSDDEEFESWIILTAWRKLRNGELTGDKSEYENFISTYITPIYQQDTVEVNNNPVNFFKKSIPNDKYKEVIKFLSV